MMLCNNNVVEFEISPLNIFTFSTFVKESDQSLLALLNYSSVLSTK